MKSDQLASIIEETVKTCKQLLVLKGGEYSGGDDRLANFKRGAATLNLQPEVILHVYAAKHWDAISQYIADLQHGVTRGRLESIDGRIDDLINYMFLLKGLLCEHRENSRKLETGTVSPN